MKPQHKIVILEDDVVTRRLLVRLSVSFSSSVKEFGTVKDIKSYLKTDAPHLVILDLGLPDGSGVEVLEEIRNKHNNLDVAVIVLTATSEEKMFKECFDLGANDFLQKPIRSQEFSSRIAHQLKLISLMSEVKRLQKKEGLILTINTLAHEINNPLTIAMGFTNKVRLSGLSPENVRDVERINVSLERIANVIKELKKVATDGEELNTVSYSERSEIISIKKSS